MIDYVLVIPILASFLVTLFLMPGWIKKAQEIGLMWEEMNRYKAEKVAGSGGLIVLLGFVIGVLIFIAYMTFYLKSSNYLIAVFALLAVVLITGGIGLIDDLLGWKRGGLNMKTRLILVAFASVPLIAINAGRSVIEFPGLGVIDLGIIYPLVFIPMGVVGATTTYNFLAGHNGVESGQGIILLSALAIVAYNTGNSWLAIIALCMIASLLAFLFYNFVPAKVFPGDVLTYSVGSIIAGMAILGNFEKIAVFFFIPYIMEVILKSRGGLKKQSFGLPQKDGTLALKYGGIYGLEHLSIWLLNKYGRGATERKVVISIWLFQIAVIIAGFIIFRKGIF